MSKHIESWLAGGRKRRLLVTHQSGESKPWRVRLYRGRRLKVNVTGSTLSAVYRAAGEIVK